MGKLQPDELTFLKESNYIEEVYDGLDDSVEAWNYLKKKKILTHENILHTHKLLMKKYLNGKQLGRYRQSSAWIGGHKAKSWFIIGELIGQWIVNVMDSVNNGKKESTDFLDNMTKQHHIKFEKIHPFIDGNGRIGRIILNWQRIKLGLPILIIYEKEKQEYYKWFK